MTEGAHGYFEARWPDGRISSGSHNGEGRRKERYGTTAGREARDADTPMHARVEFELVGPCKARGGVTAGDELGRDGIWRRPSRARRAAGESTLR